MFVFVCVYGFVYMGVFESVCVCVCVCERESHYTEYFRVQI